MGIFETSDRADVSKSIICSYSGSTLVEMPSRQRILLEMDTRVDEAESRGWTMPESRSQYAIVDRQYLVGGYIMVNSAVKCAARALGGCQIWILPVMQMRM